MPRVIRGVMMGPESVDISYMTEETDLRADGAIYQVHTISIGLRDSFVQEELDDLETAVAALLTAGLERWAGSLPVTPEQVDERIREALDIDEDEDDDEDD